jgi:plastocyanin
VLSRLLWFGILVAVGALAASPAALAKTTIVVHMVDDHYEPKEFKVPIGATLLIRNDGQEKHSFTSAKDKSLFDVDLAPGQNQTLAVPPEGIYRFYCTYHAFPNTKPSAGMAGVLTVGDPKTSPGEALLPSMASIMVAVLTLAARRGSGWP